MHAMKIHTLDDEILVPGKLEDVFAFFQDPANLAKITPPSMGFRIVSTDRRMREGLEIEYRVNVLGIPMLWKSRITGYQPPFQFADEALVSPYRLWRHTHSFRDTGNGIAVSDHVEYALPLYPLGEIGLFLVKMQLRQIFSYRRKVLLELLGRV